MLQPGDTFGDYRVLKLLGKGGMGSVFLLENAEGGQVAAKILDPATAGDHESRKRFLREAELALGVKHPNLVETYDVGEDPETGLCYILMEYVPGGSLADRIKMGPMAINDAIRIVYQIASVLELARQKGIVHRDIKPGNIMFGADGKAKLADLGIARGGIGGTETTTVTQTGMMIGTPAYMAPEQMLDAHHVDTRADIYSLGIVFYEMLTGKRPNHDDTVVQLMAKAVAGEPIPDVRTLRPEVSASVAELINLMCAMKADERIGTPAEVTTALSQIVHGREVTIVRKRPSAVARKRVPARRNVLLRILIICAIAAVVGVSAFVLVGVRELRALSSPEKPVVANVVRPIEEAAPIRQAPPKVVEKTVVITNTIEKPIEKPVEQAIEKPVEKTEEKPIAEAPAQNTPAVPEPRGETDRRVRFAEVDGLTWFYTLEDGNAVIWRGESMFNTSRKPAVQPEPEGDVVVPAELDGYKVAVIGNFAFSRCPKIKSVVIPEGVREIRKYAFHFCEVLADINLPQSLESIKRLAFYGCPSLKSVDIGRCPDAPGAAFFFCDALEVVNVSADNPSYVLEDGLLLDRMRTKLVFHPRNRDVARIPDGIRIIGEGAFLGCSIKTASIPGSVERIEGSAFGHCANLQEISFSEGLQVIDSHVFLYCARLKRLDFPGSLKRLGGFFVNNCPTLEMIVFRGDAPEFDAGVKGFLGRVPESLVIAVAQGTCGWNGPGSTDLPEKWPAGNFEDSRPIRYWKAEDEQVPLPVVTKGRVANRADVSDASATKAVQKTLDALFPGWKTTENAKRGAKHMEGYVRTHLGRWDCVCTHPQSLGQPEVVLRRDLVVPKKNPVLCFSVAAYAPLSEFRVQAKANGILVFEEDVAGGKWRDVCVDLSRWAGKQSRIELVHRAIGWNWEWAFWWRMEVGEWDGREPRLSKLVRAEKLADRSRYADPDPTKAVRKAFKALFPGWTVSENGGGAEYIGYYEEFKHRHNLVMTHPPREGVPVVLTKVVRVPKNGATLHLEVASHDHGDFELEVHVRDKVVRCELITPEQDFADIDVDLSEHAGKSVKVEIRQVPNNWKWEMAFWSRIEVK